LRPLLRQPFLTQQRLSSTAPQRKTSDPLRILFCGSDEFSAASLSALALEHTRNPSLIHSIDVLVRPPKPTGRGLTILREVPLQSVAESLSLPVHAVDTFTGWQPPLPYNLIVAVSFGLFVPPRILRSAAYGGLNVHPSLLPDLRGPAPLHHALLLGRTHTGVSLQTLSEESFDSGEVLAQTPLPGFPIAKGMKVPALRDMLAALGARMLVDGLRAGVHVPPRKDVGWTPTEEEREGIAHAPKITKKDAEIRWDAWMPETMALRARVLGDALWSRAVARDGRTKRVILSGVEEV
ncbi:Formyltransferase, partial [Coniochaeta ligniaria NRRL 30616]